MPGAIQAVIFDFGGVLIEWDPRRVFQRYFPSRPQAMEQFLREVNFAGWNALQDKGRSFSEGIALLAAEYPRYAPAIRAFWEHWEDSIGGPIPDSISILRRLKQAGYPLYGLSNWSAETFPIIEERYDFFELFNDIIISGQVKLIKPDPAIFKLAQQRIGLPASSCLLIDDSQANTEAASRLGYATVLFESAQQLEKEILERQLLTASPREERHP